MTDQKHIDALASAGPWTCGGHIAGWCPIHDGKIRDGDAYCKEAILAARTVLDSTDPAVHAAMLDALTRHGVLTEEHGYIPVDESGARWKMRSLERALQDAENAPVGDTYSDGAPRPGIATIEHGMRYQSAWKIVGEVTP